MCEARRMKVLRVKTLNLSYSRPLLAHIPACALFTFDRCLGRHVFRYIKVTFFSLFVNIIQVTEMILIKCSSKNFNYVQIILFNILSLES